VSGLCVIVVGQVKRVGTAGAVQVIGTEDASPGCPDDVTRVLRCSILDLNQV
jgi:hypothetical protein